MNILFPFNIKICSNLAKKEHDTWEQLFRLFAKVNVPKSDIGTIGKSANLLK